MVWVGNRLDLGANVFMPQRDAQRNGSPITPINGYIESDSTAFLVPEFGYNSMLSSDLAVGVSVYGNGGLNTDYPQGNFQCPTPTGSFVPANILCGSGDLGVDLMQLIIAPTVAYKFNARHAVGASLLLGYQRFEAKGLQAFGGLSGDPSNLTNRGTDSSTGVGLRLGYQGRLSDMVTIGASYATKMSMGEFDKYRGLFAESGGFDIPSEFSIGVAIMPTPAWTLALDYGRIYYSDAKSVNNPSQPPVAPLGAANGPGFGWQDIDVLKFGVSWQMSEAWTLRAGYNRGDNPIVPRDVTFNILAPGVMKDHYTAGFTVSLDKANEITSAFMYAPRQTVTGASFFDNLFGPGGGGSETIGMKQYSIGLAWARKF
jgi:long-chain fatty acid transport protein